MSIIFTAFLSLYSVGDCVWFTRPGSEYIPMRITGVSEKHYQVFFIYPGIGDINFRAVKKRFEQDTKRIDKALCARYNSN